MWFAHTLRVRYQETDRMGVVYHTNYINWFEWARTELMRACGYPYAEVEQQGLVLPVLEVQAQYKRPAAYDETVTVYVRVTSLSSARLEFAYEVRSGAPSASGLDTADGALTLLHEPEGELLVTGSTKHMWVNRAWRPARLERELPELYKLLESIFARLSS